MINSISKQAFRQKVLRSIEKYLSLSKNQSLAVGIYKNGKLYSLTENADPKLSRFDIGSISKTLTAHLILKLSESGLIELNKSVAEYIDLPVGDYPTVYELLTHTAGYGHLTPAEITVPSLLKHGYSRKNIYEHCTSETVIKCLKRRKNKKRKGYSYSDFSFAILAVVAELVTKQPFADLFEAFIQNDLGMKETVIEAENGREPKAVNRKHVFKFWHWNRNNPYIAGGGLVSTLTDMLIYMSGEIESELSYVSAAHKICKKSISEKSNIVACAGWHTYKKSDQLWHVGGVGTFRSSIIINKKRRLGVVVLGNSKGVISANVHYLTKMLYSELKINKIKF